MELVYTTLRTLFTRQASSMFVFIISNGTSAQYAERRVKDHVSRFRYLADAVENDTVAEDQLAALEHMDNIFPDVDYRTYG